MRLKSKEPGWVDPQKPQWAVWMVDGKFQECFQQMSDVSWCLLWKAPFGLCLETGCSERQEEKPEARLQGVVMIWERWWWLGPQWQQRGCGRVLVAKSCPTFATPWTVACQASLFMGFSRQEYWSGLPFPSPGDLPNPGIEPGSPMLQVDSLPTEPPGRPIER